MSLHSSPLSSGRTPGIPSTGIGSGGFVPLPVDESSDNDGNKGSRAVEALAMAQMIAAVAFGRNNITANGIPGGTVVNSSTPDGVSPFSQARDTLAAGIYLIYNLATNCQIGVWERSERNRVIGHTQLWIGPINNHDARKWTLEYTDDGHALISSLWPPPGPPRYLSLGPNVRNAPNRCRLFRVARDEAPDGNAYYICTDSNPSINPPLVMEDAQTPPIPDACSACTSPFEINNRNQMWVFYKPS